MDSAAGSLLALSNIAAAVGGDSASVDDDRSSSLSELDDGPELPEVGSAKARAGPDADSEAETERLEESPDKVNKSKAFGISPSKLAQSTTADERPDAEAMTDSAMSSPISSGEDSLEEDGLSDIGDADAPAATDNTPARKRKRLSDGLGPEEQDRSRRRRTGSVDSDDNKTVGDSDVEDGRSQASREQTLEPMPIAPVEEEQDEEEEDEEEEPQETDSADLSGGSKSKKPPSSMRPHKGRGKDGLLESEEQDHDEVDPEEESDEEADVDDAEIAAKSEEEQARKSAAMESLTALEKHFAMLRDRLYDERIAQINHELFQLTEAKPSHTELLRQLDCVQKYRDDKFEVEQKLLVYKIGALKTKSGAERAQIHSGYFQTVRDMRESHLERLSEQFYRIQRDRFKAENTVPSFTVPFPERRSQQITQQTAYNKEVSILSGVAKYVGFPAAPELPKSHQKEMDEDMDKMGISTHLTRASKPAPLPGPSNGFSATLSGPAAEEQFLEQTPWANPQHPVHRLGMHRQISNRSPFSDTFLTPANQQTMINPPLPAGSASTIAENPSAQVSSVVNTPQDGISGQTKVEPRSNFSLQDYRLHSISPSETRRATSTAPPQTGLAHSLSQPDEPPQQTMSSPLTARISLINSPSKASAVHPEKIPRHNTASPFRYAREPGITAGSGLGSLGRFTVR